MEVTIRAYDPRDAAGLADVFFRSVRQVALSDYTAAQVRAWAPEPRTAEWAHGEASDGRLVLVAANVDDRPVAYIDLEPDGHIDRLFCAPEAAGQGIASRLYDAVEAAAREQGIRNLFTEASELARRLFARKGFAVAERQDLVIRGVAIHNYRMVKALDLNRTISDLAGVACDWNDQLRSGRPKSECRLRPRDRARGPSSRVLTACPAGGMLPGMGTGEVQAPGLQEQSPSRTLWQRIAWLPLSWRRPASIALVCYAIVIVFGVTYGIVRAVSGRASGGTAVVWGICVAGPLALAFVWERLTGLKVFGVEVTLDQAIVRVDSTLDIALSEQQYFSDSPAIFRLIDKVIGNRNIELLEVNLRTTGYWWSTRLYLQAALAQDYTNIQRLVFVDGDNDRRYVGMAAPGQVRKALAEFGGLDLEFSYRLAKQALRLPEHSEAQHIVYAWTTASFFKDGIPVNEELAMTAMSTELLTRLIILETDSTEWNQPLDSARFQALVLDKRVRYVPLVQNGRLARIVNADAFARNMATQALRARNR